jgi:hypothetical protein
MAIEAASTIYTIKLPSSKKNTKKSCWHKIQAKEATPRLRIGKLLDGRLGKGYIR